MAQTVANLTDVLKEAWTSERIEKQFYDENPLLSRIQKFEATMIGEKAIVPIHKGRNGGYTTTLAAGGNLNAAGNQRVDAGEQTLINHWLSIELEAAALNQAGGSNLASVVAAKDLEMVGAINDMKAQCSRQAVMDGTGRIAQCDTGGASTTVELLATGLGYDAIVRGWLQPGMLVTVGTAADADADTADGSLITAVSESASDPDIVISDSITTDSNDYVGIYNPNSATAWSPELDGLRKIVSTTESFLGLDPQNAGEEFWSAAHVDTSTTVLSLNLANTLQTKVHQKTGTAHGCEVFTSVKQANAWYELLQNQVRFQSDSVGAGDYGSGKYRGLVINALPEIPDRDWHFLSLKDLRLVTGAVKSPTWATDLAGTGGSLQYVPGTTQFKNSVYWAFNIAAVRRNSHASAQALTA
jgi:hypothetical protein